MYSQGGMIMDTNEGEVGLFLQLMDKRTKGMQARRLACPQVLSKITVENEDCWFQVEKYGTVIIITSVGDALAGTYLVVKWNGQKWEVLAADLDKLGFDNLNPAFDGTYTTQELVDHVAGELEESFGCSLR